MVFATSLNNTLTDHMIIKSDGKVGIGTTSPSHTLQISSNSDAEGLQVNGAQNQYVASFRADTTTGKAYGPYIRAGTNSSDSALVVEKADGSSPYFKIRGDGNVGIGVADPDSKLEVHGKIHISEEQGGSVSAPAAGDTSDRRALLGARGAAMAPPPTPSPSPPPPPWPPAPVPTSSSVKAP